MTWDRHRTAALTRRAALQLGAGAAAGGLGMLAGGRAAAQADPAARSKAPLDPLWQTAAANGIAYGAFAAMWQLDDPGYADLVDRHAALVATQDDLLWYQVKPSPEADLTFAEADRIVAWARDGNPGKLIIGAHLVWDEGFGDGWNSEPGAWDFGKLRDLSAAEQRALLFEVVEATLDHHKDDDFAGWIVVNEVVDAATDSGLRMEDYLWFQNLEGSDDARVDAAFEIIGDAFRTARDIDPDALLILNEFGFETDTRFDKAADRQANALKVVDRLLADGVPVDAFGIQAHLSAKQFARRFDADRYRAFLGELAGRGLDILITELDVLDDGLPADRQRRDRAVANAYRTYLDAALDEPKVGAVINFGLADDYSWLQEDYPRKDGKRRRPLPFSVGNKPKPAARAIAASLGEAADRDPLFPLP